MNAGEQLIYEYTGHYETAILDKGTYKFEVWGAEGGGRRLSGNVYSGLGGLGGYSSGYIYIDKNTTIYIYVGGYGRTSINGVAAGGWNGGGSGYGLGPTISGNGGGGASDIRIGSTSLYARVIVAGGGGGGGTDAEDNSGHGGGLTGTNGANGSSSGTQTAAGVRGSFGQGGNTDGAYGGGGGGGWYGGGTYYVGSSIANAHGGGGGSGYVHTPQYKINYPSGCLIPPTIFMYDEILQSGVRYGNGRIVITKENDQTKYCFMYTGTTQSVTLGPGKYQLECYGAKGYNGTNGDCAKGVLRLTKETTLYINCGQSPSNTTGGWNGGSNGSGGGGGGGGKTDICLSGIINSTVWDYQQHNKSIIISAHGGLGYTNTSVKWWEYTWSHDNGCPHKYTDKDCAQAHKTHTWTSTSGEIPTKCANDNHSCGHYVGRTAIYNTIYGGAGGGQNYFCTKSTITSYPYGTPDIPEEYYVDTTSTVSTKNSGHGYVIITKIPINISYINCTGSLSTTFGDETIKATASLVKTLSKIAQSFYKFNIEPDVIIPNRSLNNGIQEFVDFYIKENECKDIIVTALYMDDFRKNTNIYKNIENYYPFDYSVFLNE